MNPPAGNYPAQNIVAENNGSDNAEGNRLYDKRIQVTNNKKNEE
jgi:hypothetical protein